MGIFSGFAYGILRFLGAPPPVDNTGAEGQTEWKRPFRFWIFILLFISGGFYLLWTFMFNALPSIQESVLKMKPVIIYPELVSKTNPGPSELIFLQENKVKKLEKLYAKFSNRQPYLIVNTSDNTFNLFNNGKLVREGLCSTGSFVLLDAGDENKWMFETPKGMLRIQGKTTSPVWRKPDWAFIEEGLPVPKHQDSFERYEYGVLGDYALSIGNGYLIHGTLYKRLLGMPVTHGCVRLGDADLEQVYKTLNIGSKVYIF
jgi:hypothetical protein